MFRIQNNTVIMPLFDYQFFMMTMLLLFKHLCIDLVIMLYLPATILVSWPRLPSLTSMVVYNYSWKCISAPLFSSFQVVQVDRGDLSIPSFTRNPEVFLMGL